MLLLPRWLSGKEFACQCRRHKRHRFNPWVRKIPWGRAWKPTSVLLPGKSHGQRSLVGYNPWGCKDSDTAQWLNSNNILAQAGPESSDKGEHSPEVGGAAVPWPLPVSRSLGTRGPGRRLGDAIWGATSDESFRPTGFKPRFTYAWGAPKDLCPLMPWGRPRETGAQIVLFFFIFYFCTDSFKGIYFWGLLGGPVVKTLHS